MKRTTQSTPSRGTRRLRRAYFTLAIGLMVVLLLFLGKVVLVPVALAVLLAFVLTPPSNWLERRGLPRLPSVLIVSLGSLTLAGLATWVAAAQLQKLYVRLPELQKNITDKIEPLNRVVAGVEKLSDLTRTGPKPGDEGKGGEQKPEVTRVVVEPPGTVSLTGLSEAVRPAVEMIGTAVLVIVLMVFMLYQRESLRDRIIRLVGRQQLTSTTRVLNDAAERVSRYLLLQLATNAVFGLIAGIALKLAGVEYAVLWGVLTVVLRFLPYVGWVLAAAGPFLLAVAAFPDWATPLGVLGLFFAVELVLANAIEPLLFGHGTGVSPVALLVAAVFWATLWGAIGLLLAIPLTVCLVVIGEQVPALRFFRVLLGDAPTLEPSAQYYQRLLAHDYDGAALMLSDYAKEHTLDELCDVVLLPALAEARADREQGTLTRGEERRVYRSTRDVLDGMPEPPGREASAETPTPTRPQVIACAPRGIADDLAVCMLHNTLRSANVGAVVTPAEKLLDEVKAHADGGGDVTVCLVSMSPGNLARVAGLCRRLKALHRGVTLEVAHWGKPDSTEQAQRYLKDAGADRVSWSLRETVAQFAPPAEGKTAAAAEAKSSAAV